MSNATFGDVLKYGTTQQEHRLEEVLKRLIDANVTLYPRQMVGADSVKPDLDKTYTK